MRIGPTGEVCVCVGGGGGGGRRVEEWGWRGGGPRFIVSSKEQPVYIVELWCDRDYMNRLT